jgi:hypothetical protein
VSGSKINEQKTEILKIGNPETINHSHIHQLVNDKVNVLGIWLGLLHLILETSVSIIRAYNEILRGQPCLIDLVIGTMFVSKPFT